MARHLWPPTEGLFWYHEVPACRKRKSGGNGEVRMAGQSRRRQMLIDCLYRQAVCG